MTSFIKVPAIRTRFLVSNRSVRDGILKDLYRGSSLSHFCIRSLEYVPSVILAAFERRVPSYLLPYFDEEFPPEVIVLGDLSYSAKTTFLLKKNDLVIKFGITKEARNQIILEKLAIRKLKQNNFSCCKKIKLGCPRKIISPYMPMCKLSEIRLVDVLPLLSSLLQLPLQGVRRSSDGNLLTYCHGDLAVWNVTKIDNELVAFDWENFSINLAGLDLFYFCASIFYLQNKNISKDDFFSTYHALYNLAYPGEHLDDQLYSQCLVWLKNRSAPVYSWLVNKCLNKST